MILFNFCFYARLEVWIATILFFSEKKNLIWMQARFKFIEMYYYKIEVTIVERKICWCSWACLIYSRRVS